MLTYVRHPEIFRPFQITEKDMKDLKGKTAIVTGGGGGIGGATCRRFAEEGAQVAVLDMNLEAAQKVADGIVAAGGQAKAFACNITDRTQVDAAVAAAEAQLGPIDILVNNAGWDIFKPFTKTVPAEWDKLIAINLTGALHMHHAVLPGMAARGAGRIVNIASDAARGGSSGEAFTPLARAVWSLCPKPWHANTPATTSPSMWSAQAQPTPPCWLVLPKVLPTPKNSWTLSRRPSRWVAWVSPMTSRVPSSF